MASNNAAAQLEETKIGISIDHLIDLIGENYGTANDIKGVDVRMALNMLSTAAQEIRILAHCSQNEAIDEADFNATMWRLAGRMDAVANLVNLALRQEKAGAQ